MKKYKMIVAYDGTDFHGWQIQLSDVTIASTLQKSFKDAFAKTVSILGASRTDSGVHALGQVAVARTDLDMDPALILRVWNNSLPNAIVIKSLEFADEDFHPFANVVSKTYYYYLFLERPLPFIARYGWFWKFIDSVDLEKFAKAMELFVGKHDFRSFCKNEVGRQTVRTVDSIKVDHIECLSEMLPCGELPVRAVRIAITSKGFLRYQIRRMIGAALDVARLDSMTVDFIKDKLANPSDQQVTTKASGCGLCLREIVYKIPAVRPKELHTNEIVSQGRPEPTAVISESKER